jgi:uncharacterized phiE125 gp8 family phage protein
MNLITVVPPSDFPVTLADMYLWLRMDPDGSPATHPDDSMLTTNIGTATAKVEQVTRRALMPQRIRLVQPHWSQKSDDYWRFSTGLTCGYIELPRPPLIEVHSVTYYSSANVLTTFPSESYYVDQESFVPRIALNEGYSWPVTFDRNDAVRVEYTAGYSGDGSPPVAQAANVPDGLKTAIKIEVQLLYDELTPEKRLALENAQARLLASYRVHTF